MGKTLTFWMPLLFRPEGIQIVVTPLNLLGKQNATSLAKAGIGAIAISSETATPANFQVRASLRLRLGAGHLTYDQAISTFQYRAVVISPEQVMKPNGHFEKLLKNPLFVTRIISFIIDEAHCLTEWGEFRPEYRELGRLRYILSSHVPLLVTSATLTKVAVSDIMRLLHMRADQTEVVHRSTDRPNIKIGVKKIKYAYNSFADLTFLIPAGFKVGDPPPPKFLIFFDDIAESINATCVLRRRLPLELRDKIKWFNADMSTTYKEAELANLVSGKSWGFLTTTSFGMVSNVK